MIRKFLASRGARKFRRSKLAMASLCVIGLYAATSLFVFFNEAVVGLAGEDFEVADHPVLAAFALERTSQRVGPDSLAGFGARQAPEKRAQQHEFFLSRLERALEDEDPEQSLRDLRFAELRVADLPIDELSAGLDRGWELFDEMDEIYEEQDEVYEQLDALIDPQTGEPTSAEVDPAEVERIRGEVAVYQERIDAKVDEIGARVAALFPRPGGVDGLLYTLRTSLGTDRQGRSIFVRTIYSVKTAIQVGIVTSVIAVIMGSILGAAAAMFGGVVDLVVIWLYSTFSSIPNLVLLAVLAFMFTGSAVHGTMIPLYTAFCLTFWIGPCRVIRGEVLKIKELEFVQAATAIGYGRMRILLRHVLPNTAHLIFINFALFFVAAIKGEVILTFLGLGLKEGASWGLMIDDSKAEVLTGVFWQIGAATAFMFLLVLAFNVFTDALQDAFDPKHVD